jgi:hypothetical protein
VDYSVESHIQEEGLVLPSAFRMPAARPRCQCEVTMTCPECGASVSRWAFFSAGGLSGIACQTCDQKLRATYESRLRLTGGGIVLGILIGGLTRSVGAEPLTFLVSFAAFAAWMLMRTEGLLRLDRVPSQSLGIDGSD